MNEEDKQFCREVGEWFYGSPPHTVTKELAEVLAKMLAAVQDKSKALSMLPQPTMSIPGWGWLVSEGVKVAFRSQKDEAFDMAVKAVALQHRTEYEMAQMGM